MVKPREDFVVLNHAPSALSDLISVQRLSFVNDYKPYNLLDAEGAERADKI